MSLAADSLSSPSLERRRNTAVGPRRILLGAAGVLLALLVGLVAMEGASALLLTYADVRDHLSVNAERNHVRFDEELGWDQVPGLSLPNQYGPGIGLSINAQGMRDDRPYPATGSASRHRLLCSGDSFTMGNGVADRETWCWRLQRYLPSTESRNLGIGGYGVDQAFLRYARNAPGIPHDLHVFAFISHDFTRMMLSEFGGAAKPRLKVENGKLIVSNQPLPRPNLLSRTRYTVGLTLASLRTSQVLRRLLRRSAAPGAAPVGFDREAEQVFGGIIRELHRLDQMSGSRSVLVYLPTRLDVYDAATADWRKRIRETAAKDAVAFIDLTEPFRQLTAVQADGMFLPEPGPAAGHYSVAGNDWISARLAEELKRMSGMFRP